MPALHRTFLGMLALAAVVLLLAVLPSGADADTVMTPTDLPAGALPAPASWDAEGLFVASPPDDGCRDTGGF